MKAAVTESPESLIPGTFNARDLGGLPAGGERIRRGALIRSDAPVELAEAGRRALRELGVRTAVDLREPVERENAPADVDELDIALVFRPVLGGLGLHADLKLGQLYTSLLDTRGEAIAQVIASIADAMPEPVIVFCSAGKDRTGVVTALLLALLGVGEDDIVADYHRTEANMRGAFRERVHRAALASGLTEQQLAVNLGAPTELIRSVLARLALEGGAEAYLRRHGLSADAVETLRAGLLEP
jgi:protein-tyrosine phosphatase